MICKKCGKRIPSGTSTCPYCGDKRIDEILGGNAKLCIESDKKRALWIRILSPLTNFVGYNIFVTVDEKEYVLKGKEKKLEIIVTPGVHHIELSTSSKKTKKVSRALGNILKVGGAIAGSAGTYAVGELTGAIADFTDGDGGNLEFRGGETITLKVKLNAWDRLVEDV